jgi:hypothetical protein
LDLRTGISVGILASWFGKVLNKWDLDLKMAMLLPATILQGMSAKTINSYKMSPSIDQSIISYNLLVCTFINLSNI